MTNHHPRRISLIVLLGVLFFFASQAYAQLTVGTVKLSVETPNGNPAPYLFLSVYDEDNTFCDRVMTDTFGDTELYGYPEGDYVLDLEPESSPALPNYQLYQHSSIRFSISTTDAGYNFNDDTFQLAPFKLQSYSRYIKVVVTEGGPSPTGSVVAPGTAISGLYVDAWRVSDWGNAMYTTTNAQGEAFFALADIDYETYAIDVYGEGYGRFYTEVTPITGVGETLVNASLLPTDATIRVDLKDGVRGGVFTVPADGNAEVKCHGMDNDQFFDSYLYYGEASATLSVSAGNYECYVKLNGYAARRFTVNAEVGQTKSVVAQIFPTSATIEIKLEDAVTGAPFVVPAGLSGRVECEREDRLYFAEEYLNSGDSRVTLPVVFGTYQCHLWFDGGGYSPTDGNVTVGFQKSATIVSRIYSANATIEVYLEDALSGDSFIVPSGRDGSVNCWQINGQNSFNTPLNAGDYYAVLDVVVGSYECEARISGFPATVASVNVASGERKTVYSKISSTNATIEAQLKDANTGTDYLIPAGSQGSLKCSQMDGLNGFDAFLNPGDSEIRLAVVPGSYNCEVVGDGFRSQEQWTIIIAGQTRTLQFDIKAVDAVIQVNLEDASTGAAYVAGESRHVEVACFKPGGQEYFQKILNAGDSAAQLEVLPGTYECECKGDGLAAESLRIGILAGQTKSLTLKVESGNSSIQVDLVSGMSGAVFTLPDESVGNVWCHQIDGHLFFEAPLAGGDSLATLQVLAGRYECQAWIEGYSSSRTESFAVSAGESRTAQIKVFSPDAVIKINLLSSAGGAPFEVPADSFGGVSCQDESAGRFFDGPLNPGDSSVMLQVVAGSYECWIRIEKYGAVATSVTVSDGQTAEVSSIIYTKDAQILLRMVDSTSGAVISGVAAEFFAHTSKGRQGTSQVDDFAFVHTTEGQASLDVIGGQTYEAGLFLRQDESRENAAGMRVLSGQSYLVPNNLVKVLASSDEVKTVDFLLTPATSSVKVVLLDANGERVAHGWADAFSGGDFMDGPPETHKLSSVKAQSAAKSDEEEHIRTGAQLIDGEAMLYLLAGREFTIRAVADDMFDAGARYLPPPAVTLTLNAGETRTVTMQLKEANYTLTIETSIEGSAGESADSLRLLECFGDNSDEQRSFVEVLSGTTATLLLAVDGSSSSWHVGCHAVVDNGEEYRSYNAETNYQPADGSNNGSIALVLKAKASYYSKQPYPFDTERGKVTTLPDSETKIEIPAKAMGDSGSAVMTAGSATGFPYQEREYPLLAFDISFTVDDEKVSQTDMPVKITFPVDIEQLEELGVDPEELWVASFDDSTKTWKPDATSIYDPETQTLSASVSHFSIWGVLIDLANSLKSKIPINLKAKKKKKRKKKKRTVILSWQEPEGLSSDPIYEIELIRIKKKRKNKKRRRRVASPTEADWEKARTHQTSDALWNLKLKAGTYYFRVRIEGGTNSVEKKFVVK